MKEKISVKVHESYRKVVVICDSELVGKKFVDGDFQLEINKHFYEGDGMPEEEVAKLIRSLKRESPSYNIVGERAVNLCLKENIIEEGGVKKISGIPLAMTF